MNNKLKKINNKSNIMASAATKIQKAFRKAKQNKQLAIKPLFKNNVGNRPQNMSNALRNTQFGRNLVVNKEILAQKQANFEYVSALLFPESTPAGAKCPGLSNMPTASTKIELVTTVKTNAQGNGLLGTSLGFIPSQGTTTCSATWNNQSGLDGATITPGNIVQDGLDVRVPTITYGLQTFPMYQKYRIVAESVELRYVGPEINRSGYFLSCYVFDYNFAATPASFDASLDRYTNFSTIRQGTWSLETTNLADNNGVRMLFVPLDPSYYTFNPLGAFQGSTPLKIVIAAVGLGNAAAIEIKRTFHIEWLVDAIGSQFVPLSTSAVNLSNAQQEQLHAALPKMINAKGSVAPESNSSQGMLDTIYEIGSKAGPIIFQLLKSIL